MLSLSVDIRHWLDEYGEPAQPVRRKALWIARMIEYGGPLEPNQSRETLIECTMRPKRQACQGLLWVAKTADGRIDAWCPRCEQLNVMVSGWDGTLWADGPMEPIGPGASTTSCSGPVN